MVRRILEGDHHLDGAEIVHDSLKFCSGIHGLIDGEMLPHRAHSESGKHNRYSLHGAIKSLFDFFGLFAFHFILHFLKPRRPSGPSVMFNPPPALR